MDDFINLPLLGKMLVVVILTPAWLPVLKELYKEIDSSLAEEGGIFGDAPDADEAKALVRKRRIAGESLISVPHGQEGKAKSPGRPAPRPGAKRGPSAAPKRRGF